MTKNTTIFADKQFRIGDELLKIDDLSVHYEYCISYPFRQDVYGNLMAGNLENFTRWGEQWNVIGAHFE